MRSDGLAVPLVFMCTQSESSRSYFYGSVANVVLSPLRGFELPGKISLGPTAMLHVQSFKRNGTPIVGNLVEKLSLEEVRSVIAECHRKGVGAKTLVWGYRAPFKYADAVSPTV
jgi:hypothetical protein